MGKSIYKAAVVGLSGIGARRGRSPEDMPSYRPMPRSHVGAYFDHTQVQVVGVCDLSHKALESCKENWSSDLPHLNYYTDYREMLAAERPDIVSVATPDHLHTKITIDAINSGVRAIWCEKPIATTLADCDLMIEAAEKAHVLLTVNHSRRWSGTYLHARQLLRSQEFGALKSIVCHFYEPRSMLFRNGTHMIDAICFFAEAEPVWVWGELQTGFETYLEYRGDGRNPETDPSATAYIKFSNGVRAYYNSEKTHTVLGNFFELICETGRVIVSDDNCQIVQNAGIRSQGGRGLALTYAEVPQYVAQWELGAVSELIHVLENNGELVSPAGEARKTLRIMLGILKSQQLSNCPVSLNSTAAL